jgi:hypothetical protein
MRRPETSVYRHDPLRAPMIPERLTLAAAWSFVVVGGCYVEHSTGRLPPAEPAKAVSLADDPRGGPDSAQGEAGAKARTDASGDPNPAPQRLTSDEACLTSCGNGVCLDCPTVDVPIRPDLDFLYLESIALVGRHLVWDLGAERLPDRDLCTGITTHLHEEGCCWDLTPEALYYYRGRLLAWADGREHALRERGPGSDEFHVTTDGRVYRIGLIMRRGEFFAHGDHVYSYESRAPFIVDGVDAYYEDGPRIMRVGPDDKPVQMLEVVGDGVHLPVTYTHGTLYAESGYLRLTSESDPHGPFTIVGVRNGVSETIFTDPRGASCFAASHVGAVFCLDDDLWFVSFRPPYVSQKLFPIDRGTGGVDVPARMTKVALSDDGGIAWMAPSQGFAIHVRRPPHSVGCSGP